MAHQKSLFTVTNILGDDGKTIVGSFHRADAPTLRVAIVREPRPDYPRIDCPSKAAEILFPIIASEDREHLAVILMSTRNDVEGVHIAAIGGLNTTGWSIPGIFKVALLCNSAAIILGHNHPSGDPSPSPEDVHMTNQVIAAAEVLRIEVLDHIIVAPDPEGDVYYSLREQGKGNFVSLTKQAE